MIEDSFPFSDVYYRMAKTEADIKESKIENEEVFDIANQMVQQVNAKSGDIKAFIESMGKMDFFIKYPEVVRQIKEIHADD